MVVVEAGTREDFASLQRWHYLGGAPAVPCAYRRAIDSDSGAVVGVLVVARPTLNASWRRSLLPGVFESMDKRAGAERVNRLLRTIARVVVDPRWRGLGVATRLVRSYLEDPLTPMTEAVAAMGSACPFFRAAGMTEHELAPAPRDGRLLDALHHARAEPWMLLRENERSSLIEDAFVRHELGVWARAGGCLREEDGDTNAVAVSAGLRLMRRPRAYGHAHVGNGEKIMGTPGSEAGKRGEAGAIEPRAQACVDDMSAPLTVFLTRGQRREVVRVLRALDRDRGRALRLALGLEVGDG